MAAFLTVGLMLDYLGWPWESTRIENAVREAIRQNQNTPDLGASLGTREVGGWIVEELSH